MKKKINTESGLVGKPDHPQLGSGLCTSDLKMNKVKYQNKDCNFYLVMFATLK